MIKVQRMVKTAEVEYPRIREFTRRALVGRSPHHGYQHAINTARLSAVIANSSSIISPSAIPLVKTVAILHDFADRKVDESGYYKKHLDRMLSGIGRSFHYGISEIIARVSLTREITIGCDDWYPVLGPDGILIRDYVSDADKLLSLGATGYQRLVDYNSEQYSSVYLWHVDNIIESRILKTPLYLRTAYARKVAPALIDELLSLHHQKLASASYVRGFWTV